MSALNKSKLSGLSSPQLRPLKGSPLSDKTNTLASPLSDKTNTLRPKATGSPILKSANHFSRRDLSKPMVESEGLAFTKSARLDGYLEGKENRSSLTKLDTRGSFGSVNGVVVGKRDEGVPSSAVSISSSCMVKNPVEDIEPRQPAIPESSSSSPTYRTAEQERQDYLAQLKQGKFRQIVSAENQPQQDKYKLVEDVVKSSTLNPSLMPFIQAGAQPAVQATWKVVNGSTESAVARDIVDDYGRGVVGRGSCVQDVQSVPNQRYEDMGLFSPVIDENNVSMFGLPPGMPECTYFNYGIPPPTPQAQYYSPMDQYGLSSPYIYSPGQPPVPSQQYTGPVYQPPATQPGLQQNDDGILATAEMEGYVSLRLKFNIAVDIATNKAIRIRDGSSQSVLSVSADGHQMALVHPKGRVLQYGSRIEIQCQDEISTKNAKMYPKGISFTADNCALVYLVDDGGARTTSDMFHDLYEANISDTLFREACKQNPFDAFHLSQLDLNKADYWRNEHNEDCWQFGETYVVQKSDGLTTVERRENNDCIMLKASPSTGKVRLVNRFSCITASLGQESHIFVKAQERRMHYNGQTCIFTVRNAGHAAGFDEHGSLRLF